MPHPQLSVCFGFTIATHIWMIVDTRGRPFPVVVHLSVNASERSIVPHFLWLNVHGLPVTRANVVHHNQNQVGFLHFLDTEWSARLQREDQSNIF